MTNTPKNNYLYHQILYQFFPLPFFIQSIHAISNKIHEQHKNDNSKNMIWYIAGLHFKIWVGGGFSQLSVNHILLEQYTMQNTWFLLGVSVFWVVAVFDWGCCTVLYKCSLLVLVLADIVPSPVALGIYN